jgi:transposase
VDPPGSRPERSRPQRRGLQRLGGQELLRDVYAADDIHSAREALETFYDWAARIGIREATRLAGTVRRWEAEILAFHLTGGASNGPPKRSTCSSRRS